MHKLLYKHTDAGGDLLSLYHNSVNGLISLVAEDGAAVNPPASVEVHIDSISGRDMIRVLQNTLAQEAGDTGKAAKTSSVQRSCDKCLVTAADDIRKYWDTDLKIPAEQILDIMGLLWSRNELIDREKAKTEGA